MPRAKSTSETPSVLGLRDDAYVASLACPGEGRFAEYWDDQVEGLHVNVDRDGKKDYLVMQPGDPTVTWRIGPTNQTRLADARERAVRLLAEQDRLACDREWEWIPHEFKSVWVMQRKLLRNDPYVAALQCPQDRLYAFYWDVTEPWFGVRVADSTKTFVARRCDMRRHTMRIFTLGPTHKLPLENARRKAYRWAPA